MKKIFLIAISALAITACKTKNAATTETSTNSPTHSSATTAFFPEASITKKFMKDFPNARKISWSKSESGYNVKFLNNGLYPSDANYGYDGKILTSNIGMDVNKLPVLAKNYLNTKYPNNTISGVMRMRDGIKETGKLLVELHNGEALVFDKDGTFIGTR